jgi:Lrp/AsnC family transcriptional regulator of ectoine degradation
MGLHFRHEPGRGAVRERTGLDATDIRILSAVQKHGQLSKTRLAEIVNLSATPCWTRLTRLRAAGYIRGYHADIALERVVDVTRVVVTVSLIHHHKADFDRFENHIMGNDAIINCVATGGGIDYVMTVVVPDISAFQELMDELLSADLAIDRYMTYFATRLIKGEQPNLAKLTARKPR